MWNTMKGMMIWWKSLKRTVSRQRRPNPCVCIYNIILWFCRFCAHIFMHDNVPNSISITWAMWQENGLCLELSWINGILVVECFEVDVLWPNHYTGLCLLGPAVRSHCMANFMPLSLERQQYGQKWQKWRTRWEHKKKGHFWMLKCNY